MFYNFDPMPILSVDYDDIVAFISNFYRSNTVYLTERLFKFGKFVKGKKQSVNVFVNNLRADTTECQFKDTLDQRVWDKFLLGLMTQIARGT